MKMTGENRGAWGKTCLSASLSTTNPTLIDLESNLGFRILALKKPLINMYKISMSSGKHSH